MINFFSNFSKKKPITEAKLDINNIPNHIAIIMDGNGRWAKQRNLPRSMGHRAGVETIREIVKYCSSIGVKYLTLYAFSTENWKRSADEVSMLMTLLVQYLKNEFNELNNNNVIINHIGDISKLPKPCRDELENAYKRTKNNTGLTLNLALNYGGRDEIIHAIHGMYNDLKFGNLKEEEIDDSHFSNYLYTAGMPDPDLIIRPSGEKRLSNFLLWQCAYSEFWYSEIKWPDFKKSDLERAIYDFQNRDRRFGGVKK